MVVKPLPVPDSSPPLFSPLPTSPQSPLTLAKEAKMLTNAERGYAADEKYLGEKQNLEQKAKWFREQGQLGVYDFEDLAELGLDDYEDLIGDR